MAKLILSKAGAADKVFALDGDRIVIGRKPENDVQIEDGTVSSTHAVLTRQTDSAATGGEVYLVEDQNSTNGTFVNGTRVSRQALKSGDILQLGQVRLLFSQAAAVARDATMVMTADMLQSGRLLAVKYLTGPNKGQVKVLDKAAVAIGTRGTCRAEVGRFGDDCYLTYIGGAHLPLVNGKKVGIDKKHLLANKDVVEAGPDQVQVLVE